jgi:tetratricopeptide (TPR) repeat protein
MILLLCGCRTVFPIPKACDCCSQDNEQKCFPKGIYFLGNHEDYYRCGQMHRRCGSYEKALEYLDRAIADRDTDSGSAKMHGMNFVPYFPHLEKGIVLYHLTKYDAALKELQTSLSQAPIDETNYYLNKVRQKKLLLENRTGVPDIYLDQDILYSRENKILLSGTAMDDNYISKVTLSNARLFPKGCYDIFIAQAQKEFIFSHELSPDEGIYDIQITAQNLIGNKKIKHIKIHVDRSAPVISAALSKEKDASVIAVLADTSRCISWCVNNGPIQHSRKEKVKLNICPNTKGQLILTAWDLLGNINEADLSTVSEISGQLRNHLWANATSIIQTDGPPVDKVHSHLEKPVIEIKNVPNYVWSDNITVKGFVRSKSPIVSLMINTHQLAIEKGKYIVFSQSVALEPGMNTITIQVKEIHGQVVIKKIFCLKKIPEAYNNKNNYAIEWDDFAKIPSELPSNIDRLSQLIYQGILDSSRFRIVTNKSPPKNWWDRFFWVNHFIKEKNTHQVYARVKGYIQVSSTKHNLLEINVMLRFSIRQKEDEVLIFDAFDLCSANQLVKSYHYLSNRLNNKVLKYFKRCRGKIIHMDDSQIIVQWDPLFGMPKFNLPIYLLRTKAVKNKTTGLHGGNDVFIVGEYFPIDIDYENNLFILNDTLLSARIDDKPVGR